MKKGDTFIYKKFDRLSVATVARVEAYHIIANDGASTIIFPKKIN